MFRFDVRRVVGALGVALSLLLVAPAAAAERDGKTRNRSHSTAVRTITGWDWLFLIVQQFSPVRFVGASSESGHLIDPDGSPIITPPPPPVPVEDRSETSGDSGHLIDPDG